MSYLNTKIAKTNRKFTVEKFSSVDRPSRISNYIHMSSMVLRCEEKRVEWSVGSLLCRYHSKQFGINIGGASSALKQRGARDFCAFI